VYVSVRGRNRRNEFSIIIWDMIFQQDEYTVTVLLNNGDTTGQLINLVDQIRETEARFSFKIRSGNEAGLFALDPATGVLTAASPLPQGSSSSLLIVAQNTEHSCHRAKVVVNVVAVEEVLVFDLPQPATVSEAADLETVVATVSASSSSGLTPTYSITGADPADDFSIDPATGDIAVASPLDFEQVELYSLNVTATGVSTVATAIQVINVEDVNDPPFFVTECAITDSCVFSVPESEPANAPVGTVEASDPDSNPAFNTLDYSLESDVPIPFQVSGMGVITTTEPLDFETTPSYSFMLVVMDMGNPLLAIQTLVTVNVVDVPENAAPVS
jgi:hypothetical protein